MKLAIYASVVAIACSVYLGLACQGTSDDLPVPTVKPSGTSRPYTISDLLGTPDTPSPTPVYSAPALPTAPPPKPTATYDYTPIPYELDDCTLENGCKSWICHYDADDPWGYHIPAGPRKSAAHLTQHPKDYRDAQWEAGRGAPCRKNE